jgi:hypothetical protein
VIRLTLVVVCTCRQTSAPINLYGPLRDDVMGLPQYWLPANRERSKGTERGTGDLPGVGDLARRQVKRRDRYRPSMWTCPDPECPPTVNPPKVENLDEALRERSPFSTSQLAEWLKVPVATIYAWRRMGYGPPGSRIGKRI